MGWTFTHLETTSEAKRKYCDNLWREDIKVLKSQMVGTTYYAALQDENGVHAAVVLTAVHRNDYCNFGYKDMSETWGPIESKCPASILKLLTPPANEDAKEWRKRCYDYHAKQKEIRKAKKNGLTGYVVKTVRGYVTKVTRTKIFFGGLMQYKVFPTRELAENVVNRFNDDNRKNLIPVVCEITRDSPTANWN